MKSVFPPEVENKLNGSEMVLFSEIDEIIEIPMPTREELVQGLAVAASAGQMALSVTASLGGFMAAQSALRMQRTAVSTGFLLQLLAGVRKVINK